MADLERRPEARALTVEELVDRTHRGLVRVPSFQRGLKWQGDDVRDLLDSIHRQYPIGALLLWDQAGSASRVSLGPIVIDAPETTSAWWVIDGQQRITALAATLGRPESLPLTADDPYSVLFDARKGSFERYPANGAPDQAQVPVHVLLDTARLGEWLYTWAPGRDAALRRAVLDAGKRLREYTIPVSIVTTQDETVLRDIFYRVNTAGRRLEWDEVHDALFARGGAEPVSLHALAREVAKVGMGAPSRLLLVRALMAMRGLDASTTLKAHLRRDPRILDGAVAESVPVLRRALSFLRERCAIPHLALLPYEAVLPLLARVFVLHPEPNPRTLELLARWVWRGFQVGLFPEPLQQVTHQAVHDLDADEEASVQRLLASIDRGAAALDGSKLFRAPFDARSPASRLCLLALASRRPRHLITGVPLDVALVVDRHRSAAYPVWRRLELTDNCARFLHPPVEFDEALETRLAAGDDDVLRSHAMEGVTVLEAAPDAEARLHNVADAMSKLAARHARWNANDRPSLRYLLAQADAEDAA